MVDTRRGAAEGRPRHRALELLCRPGRDPLLPAARRAARQRLLRPGRGRHQGPQGARSTCSGASGEGVRPPTSTHVMARVTPLELGPPVGWPLKFRVSGPDPMQDARAGASLCAGARREPQHAQHQLRLERAGQGDQGRGRPGPRAGARHQLAAACRTASMPCCRARRSRSCATAPI